MFTINNLFHLIFITIGLCDAGNITIKLSQKCAMSDGECLKMMLMSLVHQCDKTGFEELNIPSFNPYAIKNTTVSVLGMVNLTMIDGMAEGLMDCSLTKFEVDMDKRHVISESNCDTITVSGHYKIEAGPLVQSLSGNSVSGDGNGKIQIDKMTLKMKMPFYVEKREDDIYLIPNISGAEYSTNNINNISFHADNVMLGNQEVSERLMQFMNNNWLIIYRSFGKYFSDKIMEVFYEYLKKFFLEVPAKNFTNDDLSSYVKS